MTADGNLVYKQEELVLTWKSYLKKLYGTNDIRNEVLKQLIEVDPEEIGDKILRDEFDHALVRLKDKNAPGKQLYGVRLRRWDQPKEKNLKHSKCGVIVGC